MPSGKKLVILVVILSLVGAACAALYNRYFPTSRIGQQTARRAGDLARPDALIRSSSLAKLPRDLLRLPLAKDILTEDIVDYYEHHDGRLALNGALRRIAFENKLQLPDRLIEMALDTPAEIALWSDGRGRLRHFAVTMTRNTLARVITLLLPLHSQVATARPWPEIHAEALVISSGQEKLMLLARGDRVVILSDGLLDGERRQGITAIVNKLLAMDASQPSVFAQAFDLSGAPPEKGHEIVIAARALAFGYEHFTPGLGALRLVFDDTGTWQSAVLLDGQAATTAYAPLWRALPHGAAFCAALPVDWPALGATAQEWREQDNDESAARADIGDLLAKFGQAAVCWYGGGRLYTPLFATVSNQTFTDTERDELMRLSLAATKVKKPDKTFNEPAGAMWLGSLSSPYGFRNQEGKHFFHPAAAVFRLTTGNGAASDVAFFSPEAALLTKGLGVALKKFPALADGAAFPANDQVIAWVDPTILAVILRNEIVNAAPAYDQENFLATADFLFMPRLQALARYAPQAVSFRTGKDASGHTAAGWQWYPLTWNSAGKAKASTTTNASNTQDEAIEP